MPKTDKEAAARVQSAADRSGDAKAKAFAARMQSAADRAEHAESTEPDQK